MFSLLASGIYLISTENSSSAASFGFSHLASIMMAMDHFNARNGEVVPELRDNPEYDVVNCPIQFDWSSFQVFDTGGGSSHAASRNFVNSNNTAPCVVVGPFHDVPTLELSGLSAAYEFPILTHRGLNVRVSASSTSPYTTQMFPSMVDSVQTVADALAQVLNRTNFTAFVYALSDIGVSGVRCDVRLLTPCFTDLVPMLHISGSTTVSY
jgi:hypothetical protein